MSEQGDNLDRVSARIGAAIVDFFQGKPDTFFAEEMRVYVSQRVGKIAPGSPDRVMRDLRQKSVIDYKVLSRSKSQYQIIRHPKQAHLFQ